MASYTARYMTMLIYVICKLLPKNWDQLQKIRNQPLFKKIDTKKDTHF